MSINTNSLLTYKSIPFSTFFTSFLFIFNLKNFDLWFIFRFFLLKLLIQFLVFSFLFIFNPFFFSKFIVIVFFSKFVYFLEFFSLLFFHILVGLKEIFIDYIKNNQIQTIFLFAFWFLCNAFFILDFFDLSDLFLFNLFKIF